MLAFYNRPLLAVSTVIFCLAVGLSAYAQSGGNSTSVTGTVLDPSGAVIPDATVEIHNPVSQFARSTTTDSKGNFTIPNVPFNPYHMSITAAGFAPYSQDIDVRSLVPLNVKANLKVTASSEVVTVESGTDLIENDPTFHTDVDKAIVDRLPLESASSSLSSAVTLATPGVAADSNGFFHGMGDHAENSFSLDGQPITDQQSKTFSNQVPLDAVQSIEVISGAPPAEYGEKASLVINLTTRSGQGVKQPTGDITASYGSFGTANVGANFAYGGDKWGNFISANGLNSGRFLDPPEFAVMHAKGNEENLFDRVDYQISTGDSVHLNFGYTRSWFQNPNSFDAQNATAWKGLVDPTFTTGVGPDGRPVGPSDQRAQIKTFNIAPSWTRLMSASTVLTLGGFVRRDQYNYYPSDNPFADLQPDLQSQTVGQDRKLTNGGARAILSYVKGIHNVKAGVVYQQTFLDEHDTLGIVDPTFNDPSSSSYNPVLAPYDLTRGGRLFVFDGHTDVKLLSLYVQDAITKGNWALNVGLRGDFYNGLSTHKEAQPRLGVAYNIKRSNTVLRASYARVLETPFNENLVLSSTGCANQVLSPLLGCNGVGVTPFLPGWRNEFHVGFQQAFGKYVVFSGEYIWKYTHNGYDFSILGSTPITFPIEWHNSKIPGYAGRVSVPNFHGFSALMVFSSVASRFFQPQLGGAGATPSAAGGVFRIDHDEKFNQTTHIQYQPWQRGPWLGFNWRYDGGLVAGPVPCAGGDCNNGPNGTNTLVDVSGLSPDQQFQAGLFCGAVRATPPSATNPLGTPISANGLCPGNLYGSTLVSITKPGTNNADHNPNRIAPRHLFDIAVGHDNLFHGDKYKVSLQFTAVNIANKYAVYNFISTFSGTHYVTPRTLTAQLGFHF
jgi:Carboxypeptidase regulatory-like domain/TonB-dependent Receptor Plug Domain